MNRSLVAALLCLAVLPGLAAASGWPPIPPEVWALKEADLPGGMGAINLTRLLRVTDTSVLNEFRIRICSERGRRAAEFTPFAKSVTGLRGRVVYPDGRELAFDSQKDFHSKLRVAQGGGEVKEDVLVPPGLTDDCLVDLRWEVPQHWAILSTIGIGSESWVLASSYPTRLLTVELAQPASFDFFFSDGGLGSGPARTAESVVMTLKDVPADLDVPFALKSVGNIPRLRVYVQGRALRLAARQGSDAYWMRVDEYYKEHFTQDLVIGERYAALSEALRKDLPPGPQARATELALRLRDRVLNLSRLSEVEKAARSRADAADRIGSKDLEGLARRGTATSDGILVCFVHLLKEAGVPCKLVLVVDREKGVFRYNDRNISQIDDHLICVKEAGKPPAWLDPTARFAPPTLVLPQYQAAPALEIDTTTWDREVVDLPSQPAATNQRIDTYRLELLPDHDRFTYEGDFLGCEDLHRKREFMDLEPRLQARKLRERLEFRLETLVDSAEVLDAADPRKPIRWKAEGRIDRAQGRHRFVDPFPMTPTALPVPEDLPETRRELIVLPWLLQRHAVSRFKVPPGYDWKGQPAYERSNAFGSVSLTAERVEGPGGSEVVATLHVEVVKALAHADKWPDFRTFLGWIREAGTAQLILERQP